jgi:hypothetical protein
MYIFSANVKSGTFGLHQCKRLQAPLMEFAGGCASPRSFSHGCASQRCRHRYKAKLVRHRMCITAVIVEWNAGCASPRSPRCITAGCASPRCSVHGYHGIALCGPVLATRLHAAGCASPRRLVCGLRWAGSGASLGCSKRIATKPRAHPA